MINDLKTSRDPYSLRVAIVATLILVFAVIIVVRLAGIQLLDSENLRGYADGQGMRSEDILPERGWILDRNDNILANNIIEYSVGARYIDLLEPENAFKSLAKAFDKTPDYYRNQFKKQNSYYILETQVRPEIVGQLRSDKGCHGLKYDKKMSRIYPYRDGAGQVLGFLWDDGSGQAGIEKYYDSVLRGQKGQQTIQRDKRGNVITCKSAKTKPAIRGGNVKLTLDIEYQVILEEELENAVKKSKGESGIGVIMDPQTGEILAMANYPTFNPNQIRNSSPEIRRNRVISDQFEPGSIFKFIPVVTAFENNIFSPTSRIFCENGEWRVKDRVIHDTKPHEWLTVEEIITLSSNIGAGKIAYQVGDRAIYDMARKFGFGEPTAIGLWGETGGNLKTPDKWSSVGYSQVAMGHGLTVTLMQMASAYATIANGGTLLKPYIVSETYNSKNKLTNEYNVSSVRRVLSEETAASMQCILEEVVTSGTGKRAYIDGYHIAGKTGTAQKVIDGKYSNSKYHASFLAFFPASNPVLVCGIMIDEPAMGMHHGSIAVAPAVKNVFTRMINTPNFHTIYKALPKPEPEPITDSGKSSSHLLLSMLHAQKKPVYPIEKDKIPEPEVPSSPMILEDYDIIMPNVVGIHILNAEQKLEAIGLKVERNIDRGKVSHQYPAAGTYLKENASCRLEVRP